MFLSDSTYQGLIATITCTRDLTKYLHSIGLKYLMTSKINQGHLEVIYLYISMEVCGCGSSQSFVFFKVCGKSHSQNFLRKGDNAHFVTQNSFSQLVLKFKMILKVVEGVVSNFSKANDQCSHCFEIFLDLLA